MDFAELVWSEFFEDDDLDATFDRHKRAEPPWFGFVPRVLAVNLSRPYQPRFALWREGEVIEEGAFSVDRRRVCGKVKPLLLLAERFADLCRERNLFGAYLAVFDFPDDAERAAATAAVIREADWCGMFVAEPTVYRRRRGDEPTAALATTVASRLAAGGEPAHPLVARRRFLGPSAVASHLSLEEALVTVGEGGRQLQEDKLDKAGALAKAEAVAVDDVK